LMSTGFLNSFGRNTSPIDWCEPNFSHHPKIAEFYNTLSNALFLLMPPLLIHLFKPYGKYVHQGIHIVWLMLIVVGISSAYFHATLSLVGQLLDEISIIWVYSSTMIFFCPRRYLPKVINKKANFTAVMLTFSVTATILSVWHPIVNAFALMCLTIPTLYLLYKELERIRYKDPRVYELGIRTMVVLVCAIVIWINDRLFCSFYTSRNVNYLHAIWHILIFLSSYALCVLFAYFFVESEKPNTHFTLSYWPRNDCNFTGIPYIEIKREKLID